MARKLLLIPEERWRGMLSQLEALIGGTSGGADVLDVAHHQMASTLGGQKRTAKGKRMDAGNRNALYNQQLRGYLQLRRELRDKPVRVELSTGPKLMVDQATETAMAIPDDDSIPPEQLELASAVSGAESEERVPIGTTPRRYEKQGRRSLKVNDDLMRRAFERHYDLALDHIQRNPREYRVSTTSDHLLNSKGEEVRGSSLKETLWRVLEQALVKGASTAARNMPMGASHLRTAMNKDAYISRLLDRGELLMTAKSLQGGQKFTVSLPGPVFKPTIWGASSSNRQQK